jgi:hypothetical protein
LFFSRKPRPFFSAAVSKDKEDRDFLTLYDVLPGVFTTESPYSEADDINATFGNFWYIFG